MQVVKHKYIICLFLLIGLGACRKSVLDLSPHDQLSEGTFWKTEQDAQLALTGCYHTLSNSYFNMDNYPAWDALSDNAWAYNNNVGAKDAMIAPINSTTGGIVTDFYNNTYSQIAVCNYFLDNIDKVKAPSDEINEWKGEALFLRSFYYFYLTQFYGDVPLILHSYTLSDPLISKSSKDTVTNQLLEDLNTAISYLPDALYTDGHAVKGSALLLKARILLYNQHYTDAANAAEQVISSGKFHLYGDYQKIFETDGQGSDNTEIMFSVRYLSPDYENISALRWGWWMSMLPFQNLVDEYECTDGKPISESPLYNPANPYSNRDPRLNASIMVPGSAYGFDLEGAPDWNGRIQYIPTPLKYNMRKYVEPSKQSVDAGNHCENDVVLLRYADVLLTYAEAQNESAGPDASVYNAINLVRARVNMPPLQSGLSQTDMREKIRHERRVEFAFEGQRWLDLKRWGLAEQKINAIGTDQAPVKYIFQSNNYLWPFPQSEIDYYKAHGSDLGQNAGY